MYVFIGPQWGNFKVHSYQNLATITAGVSVTGGIKDEHKHFKAGLLVGLGMEQMLSDGFSVGLEYDFADYGHLNFNEAALSTLQAAGATVTNSHFDKYSNMHFITNSMLLKFNYYYC
jgi:opacity protein-like surface antigen